jgi:hypothetical protein
LVELVKLTLAVLLCHLTAYRLGTISLLFLPALAWVGFNMLQPATNQLNRMNEIREGAVAGGGRKKRGLAGAVGLGAALSMFAAQNADAATELSQLAASDNRWVFEQARSCGRYGGAHGSKRPGACRTHETVLLMLWSCTVAVQTVRCSSCKQLCMLQSVCRCYQTSTWV